MLTVMTWNVNGLRAALRKGFADVLDDLKPDVVLLQEVRAMPDQLGDWASPAGWHCLWHPAEKPGYSGTAILSRRPVEGFSMGLGQRDPNEEGQFVHATLGVGSGLSVASVYLPSGSSGEHRQVAKEAWMPRFRRWCGQQWRDAGGRPLLIAGDFNIAMTPRDIFYARNNENTSGYLPHERAWMQRLVKSGWRDLIREAHEDAEIGPFTWWSNRGRAMELDRGWRIDYLLGNDAAAEAVASVRVHRDAVKDTRISDHAPVTVKLRL